MVYFPYKRLIAHILLLSHLLTSCGTPRYLRITPSSYIAPLSYTFIKPPGYEIVLKPDRDNWQAMVHDNRFPGLRRSYPASVVFEKGYCLEDFSTKDPDYQSSHIHLLSSNKLYIGSLGLKGGGCCSRATWSCICGFVCPASCCEPCCGHKGEHANCRVIAEQQQALWNAQAKSNRLSKEQELTAQWKKAEQSRQSVQAAEESRISQELESLRSDHASARRERAKERRTRALIRQGIERENIKSTLRAQGDLLLYEKDIYLTDSETEEEFEPATTTPKSELFDTSAYQLLEPSASQVSDNAWLAAPVHTFTSRFMHDTKALSRFCSSLSSARLWHELANDPIADPISLETFQTYWASISKKYTKEEQTSLLQSLWPSNKKKQLSLAKINDILDLILSTHTEGDAFSYNEPFLDQLIPLRNHWLKSKLGALPEWSAASSTCNQIADILASSHLSIHFIDDFLNQMKLLEAIGLSSLLSFLTFVKTQGVPEAILSTIISTAPSDSLNHPRSWLTNLAVQWLSIHLSAKNPNIPSSLFSSIYKKFDQDISVIPIITDFVTQHSSLVASNSTSFTSVLDLLYTYQIGSNLCSAVLESLPRCAPSEWLDSSDKLIIDQLFCSNPSYSVKELIDQIVQKSPDCLQNTLSVGTTKPYTHLASHRLERVCRQHIVKSLQPCLKNELEFLKASYYSAIHELTNQERKLHDQLDALREEKQAAYQAFNQLKIKHDGQITTIDNAKSAIIAQLDKIDKEEKEELSKIKKEEEALTQALGDKAKAKPKLPESTQDNTSKVEESEKEQLQSRLQSLNQQRSDLQVSFKASEITYEKDQAKLAKSEEALTDTLDSLEVTKQVYQEKAAKLSKVSINNFGDYESYNELLESLCRKINDPNLTVQGTDLLVNLKDKQISRWTREDLALWATALPKVITSSFSSHIITIIAAIKRAITLSQGSTCSHYQLLQLLSLLFPFKEHAWVPSPVEDPLVVAILASIAAFYMGQVSFITDDQHISISESQIKGYFPLFDLLKLQVTKRSNLPRMPTAFSGQIVYGSQSDFKEYRLNLLDYEQLKKRQKVLNSCYNAASSIFPQDLDSRSTGILGTSNVLTSIDSTSPTASTSYKLLTQAYESIQAAYSSPSTILQSSKDPLCNSFKDQPISSWTIQELSSWAKYLSDVYSPKQPQKSELIAVVKRAVELSHGFSPRESQILTLITLLPNSNKGRLAQVNTGEGKSLIVAMLAAIHALEGKNVDVITTSTELSIPEVEKQHPFFSLLHLTVSENSKTSNKASAYKSDIVYGTASDFQADILRKEFLGDAIRGSRNHDIVLVDEVDSMLFDNRTHSVRLASGNPGMNHLLLPLGTIWHYIQNIARHMFEYDGVTYFIVEDYIREGKHIELLSSPGENWRKYATKVADAQTFITEKTSEHLGKLLRNLTSEEKNIYRSYIDQQYTLTHLESENQAKEESLKQAQLALEEHPWKKAHYPVIDIPEHLRVFANQQIPYWIKNGINALYSYSKDKHYKVINNKIIPVQYNETGVLQRGLVWSDGLAQFLQMKEGLPVDPEGVATNFISNVGFFKRYGNAIYGLTGTLGDTSTQNFLSELYGTDFVVIPPHKRITIKDNHHSPYLCKELAPIIVDKANWQSAIIQQSLYHAHQKRAVLVICKFIYEANALAEQIKKHYPSEKIFTYTGEDQTFEKKEKEVNSGDIIIATNIAGRGTDFKTSEQVEAHGGLYVAVTFLPESYRVELQNAGRTGRKGKKGMAQLILCQNSAVTIAELKSERDKKEVQAIEHAKEEAKRMLLLDALFQSLCALETKYLPSAHDYESLRLAQQIIPQWKAYLSSRFTESKLKSAFQKWASSKKDIFQKRSLDNRLSTKDQASVASTFEKKLLDTYDDYKQEYKTQLLAKFRQRHPVISDELVRCLANGSTFTIAIPELAQRYEWGKFESKALEERWALWLKGKHIDHGSLSKALSLLEAFDQEFASTIEQDAQADHLITNPYFHVLKGNDWIDKQAYDKAIVSFDRAIDLDPIFSVHARYNKARALLTCDNNRGKPQEAAFRELQKAQTIITTIYRPNLLSFYNLVGRFKSKTHTARDIQQILNLINQQENYIQRACKVIQAAQKKNHKVKLTNTALKSAFPPLESDDYDKAIKEAHLNGLTHFFTVKEVIPTTWASIISLAIIGLAQVTAGVLMLCTTGTGLNLIKEGLSDLTTTVKSAIHGSFSWAAWATQKAISITVSLFSAGWSSLKASCQSVKDSVKDLVLSSTKVKIQEEVTKSVTKVLATELTKGVTGELLSIAGKWVANKVLLEGLEDKIRSKVETALHKAFQSNEIIQKGLSEDIKNENKNWQKRFIAVGHRILAEKASLHPFLSMVKEIAKGVACSKVEYLDESLKAAGVVKMLVELNTFTQNFIEDFSNEVNNYKEAFNASNERIGNQIRESDTNDLLTMAPTPLDNETGTIAIDQVADGTRYCSKEIGQATTLENDFSNLGASTNENLVSHFQSHISNKLINILHEGVDPVTSYATSTLNNKFFKNIDAVNAKALHTLKVNRVLTRVVSKAAQQTIQTEIVEANPAEKAKETDSLKYDKGKEIPTSNKEQVQLSPEAKVYQKEFSKDGPKDRTAFATLSAVLGLPIHLYNAKGERTSVIENGKGPAIQLVFESTRDGQPGHYSMLSNSNIKNPDYQIDPNKQNCWLDAIILQIPPEKLILLGGRDGIIKKGMDHMDAHPEVYNQLCEQRAQISCIAPEALNLGGGMPADCIQKLMELEATYDKLPAWAKKMVQGGKQAAKTVVASLGLASAVLSGPATAAGALILPCFTDTIYQTIAEKVAVDQEGAKEAIVTFLQEKDPDITDKQAIWMADNCLSTIKFTGELGFSYIGGKFVKMGVNAHKGKKLSNRAEGGKRLAKQGGAKVLDKLKGNALAEKEQLKIVGGKGTKAKITSQTKNFKLCREKYLEKSGIDAHKLKKAWVGKANIAKFNIHRDTKTGELVLVSIKYKNAPPIPTGKFIN